MNRKSKLFFQFFTVVCLCVFYFLACKKIDYSKTVTNFTKEDAQKWWRTTFVTSSENLTIDNSSEIVVLQKARNIDNDPDFNGKRPDWKNAFAYRVGKFECVEAPLIYKNKIAVIDTDKELQGEQKHKIAETKLDKLVIIKAPNGEINVRIMTITGSYNYINSKGYDISNNHSNYIDPNFSGTIQVRRWSEKVVGTRLVESGKVKKLLSTKKFAMSLNNSTGRYDTPSCPEDCPGGVPETFYAHVCSNIGNYSEGDAVVVTACGNHSNANTFICTYLACNNVGTLESCLYDNILPQEDCYCIYWGMDYCDDGDNGGDNSNDESPCPIENTVETNQAIKDMFIDLRTLSENVNTNFERSYRGTINAEGTLTSTMYQSNDIAGEVTSGSLPVNQQIDFLNHNHYNGGTSPTSEKTYNIYSPTDLITLYKLVKNNNVSPNFFYMLSVFGEQYMLTIDNSQEYIDFIEKKLGETPTDFQNAVTTLEALFLGAGIIIGNSTNSTNNQKTFLNFIKASGLKFFRNQASNNNFNNWKPKKIDPNDPQFIVNDPCN